MKKLHNKVSKILNKMDELRNDLFLQYMSPEEKNDFYEAKEFLHKFARSVYLKMSDKQKGL